MPRKVRSIFALLALILFLGTGAAHALPPPDGPSPDRAAGTLAAIWGWVTSLFEVEGFSNPLFEASSVVPSTPLPTGSQGDGGAFIDPNGGG